MASASSEQHVLDSIRTESEHVLRTEGDERLQFQNLIVRILEILPTEKKSTSLDVSVLSNVVYNETDMSGPGPNKLQIFVTTLLSYAVENYDSMHKYFSAIVSLFTHDPAFICELCRTLCRLEELYIDVNGTGNGSNSETFVVAFGSIVGEMFMASIPLPPESKETIELCAVGFMSKWSSGNQRHSVQQGLALEKLLIMCMGELHEHIPIHLNDLMRSIESIVLSSSVPKEVKQIYLRIFLASGNTVSPNPSPVPEGYVGVNQMLNRLGLGHLTDVFTANGIRDSTLSLPWPELRVVLEESGIKKGTCYEIKVFLCRRERAVQQRGLGIDSGKLLPPSAFVLP